MIEAITKSEDLDEILKKHGHPAPRYVAYPSPNLWKDSPPSGERIRRLRSVLSRGMSIDLYVHVPFCSRLCYYCGCNTEIRTQKPEYGDKYLISLRKELERINLCSEGMPRVSSVHLGGGTPTFLSENQLTSMMSLFREFLEFNPEAEFSVETNPETVTPIQLETLRELGFSRISLGIQDFNRDTQWAINRYHPYERVRFVVETCRNLGFTSINFDLVYGLPMQNSQRFERTVEKSIALEPDRVALYHFAFLPEKMPHQKRLDAESMPHPHEKLRIFETATSLFVSEGYLPVGMDHFSKPEDSLAEAFKCNRLKRTFMGYVAKSAKNLLGLGPGAISYLDGAYLRNSPSTIVWGNALDKGGFGQDLWHEQTDEDRTRHALINELLCHLVIRDKELTETMGALAQGITRELKSFARDGILKRAEDSSSWNLTRFGRPFARTVARLFDSYKMEALDRAPCSRVA